MKKTTAVLALLLLAAPAAAAIRRDPNGVNVNADGATTVFITFGGLAGQRPAEAFWCGELVPAAPDIGSKCDPATIFGRLPLRYDLSQTAGSVFTDVMSIPPSVSRRAYQAAVDGARSSFFYVRRFVSTTGGPDEYVFVTCRLAGGGARVPFSLLDVTLGFASNEATVVLESGKEPPPISAEILYNGTGRLQGRWEVVMPGEEPPSPQDLLTEGSLPPAERPFQPRYTQVQRFNVFLPPTGRYSLPGPEPARLPRAAEGLYLLLLRVEATDDKEADSNLALAGAGEGIVHSGAVAGFPMPVLRYYVAGPGGAAPAGPGEGLRALEPADQARIAAGGAVQFSWTESALPAYRLEVEDLSGQPVLSALLPRGSAQYRAPSWLSEKGVPLRWRVSALDAEGEARESTSWRALLVSPAAPGSAVEGDGHRPPAKGESAAGDEE